MKDEVKGGFPNEAKQGIRTAIITSIKMDLPKLFSVIHAGQLDLFSLNNIVEII
jgi:hypothetical protein